MTGQAVGYCGTSHEPTWTTAQVAEYLGLKRQTVYNELARNPDFPQRRKQGTLNAFIPSEVAAYREKTLGLNDELAGVAHE